MQKIFLVKDAIKVVVVNMAVAETAAAPLG